MILQLENISLKRNGNWILKDVNWQIEERKHWVLYGLNGAGKTALLNTICAFHFPTNGQATVLGKVFGKTELGTELRKMIGIVSTSVQNKFYENNSAFEIVLSGAYASIGLYEKPTEEIRNNAIDLLKEMGCLDYADREYSTLSQGERQRVLICRALMAKPELLILDEPMTGLDFVTKEYLLEVIDSLASKSTSPTIIYVTHHVEEILPIFKNTMLLKHGEVYAAGPTNTIISDSCLSNFFDLPVKVNWNQGRATLTRRFN